MADGKIQIDFDVDSDKAEKAIDKVESKAKTSGANIQSAITGAFSTAAIIGFVDKAVDATEEVEEGFNNVIKATGATGDAAEGLETVYQDVAGSVVGSFEDIGSAVGELNTMFGLTGDALEEASEQAMEYAKVNGTDVTTSIHDVAQMMNNAGIDSSEFSTMLDELTVAAQQSGVNVDTLTTSVNDNAATLKEMGYSTEESIALLANFEKTGADTSGILSGMKKGIASWTEEGKDAKEEFKKFIQGVQDGTVSAQDAIDIFGSRGYLAVYDAAQKGQLSYEQMFDAIANGSDGALDSVYEDTLTSSDRIDLVAQNLQLVVADTVAPVLEGLEPVIEGVCTKIQELTDWWSGLSDGQREVIGVVAAVVVGIGLLISVLATISSILPAITAAQAALNAVMSANPIALVVIAIAALIAIFVLLWNNCEEFRNFWLGLWDGIQSAAGTVVDWFTNTFVPTITGIFQGIGDFISNLFRDPFGTLRDAVLSIIDWVSEHFKLPTIEFPHIDMPHFSIQGEFSLTPPSVPTIGIDWYAKGGYFNSPTVIGVGEAGGEYVLNESQIDQLADRVGGGDSGITVTIEQFVNNDTSTDIDTLMNEIGWRLRQKGVTAWA